jgi:hypothetical protein
MSNIIFRGAFIRFSDLRAKEESGVFARIHFTSEMSAPVIQAMEWGPVPDCMESAKLTGTLTAHNLVLTPNQKELRQHEIQIECTEVSDFQLFRIQGDDGESTRTELRFIARVVEPGAISRIENYMRLVGTSKKSAGALKVTFEHQEKLDLGADEPGCVDCANGVPLVDGDESEHVSGQACGKHGTARKGKEAPLASAREAGVGTHQRKSRLLPITTQ